jgi:hypothetical protein
MAIILGVKQSTRTYQLLQEENNFSYINSINSSNLLFLNVDENTNNNAVIRFKNNYEIGYIDDKISIFNTSNLITINNSNINLYKNVFLHSNLDVNNYFYTSNNITYFNNNILLNLNNNINNSFKINFDNNPNSIFDVSKDITNIRTSNLYIYSSNITLSPNSILYTNFIDSPNNKPVVIRNMAFAESLRIFTANIIQNISVNNDILFSDLISDFPQLINPYTSVSDQEWTQYMINNNTDILDPLFIKPNINVDKYLGINNNIGGSNIVEFNVKYINSSNNNLIFSINNKGYISIGSNYNPDIPLKININPINSNIIQYTNINDSNKSYAINSNGFMNIGSTNFYPNQINIFKNNNKDLNNSDLISLNINNINNTSNIGSLNIRFNNNNNYTDFIFDVIYSLSQSSFNSSISNYKLYFTINITHLFIINNILTIISPSQLYNNGELYSLETSDSDYISLSIKYPKNGITITEVSGIDYTLIYKIYPSGMTPVPSDAIINNTNLFNKIVITKIGYNIKATFIFYIYIGVYTYIYNGKYYPKVCNYITAKTNDLTIFNISQKGNVGIGTSYSDLYKLYIEDNALINNINCKTIDNYLTKNISMCNCILNNIDTINNAVLIKSDNLISSNNFLSNLENNNTIINSNLTVLSKGGKFIVNTKSIFGPNINPYDDYLITINCSNIIDGLVIKNDIINNNPNLLIYSSCANSYPYIKLQSSLNSYNIGITSNNNFQIKYNNNNNNIIENNYINNSISLFNNSFNIFKDIQNNIKFYAGQIPVKTEWYNYISELGNNTTNKSAFNIYGDFNVYSTVETNTNALIPLIICKKNTINDKFKIGIGIENTTPNDDGINSLMINYETIFNSNISVLNNIYLSGTILSISDCNLKTDIHKIENSLDKIQTISGYTYKRTDTGNLETGLIAQEVIKILPEVINYNNNNNYTISYGNMCGILVECIKELNEKIKILNSRIDNLEKK